MQVNEIDVDQAIAESARHCEELAVMAGRHRQQHTETGVCQTIRHWERDAGTWCYQTHIAIADQAQYRLAWLADIFYHGAALASYPWYPQFGGGECEALLQSAPVTVDQHQLCWGCFDLGLSAPRYYRQLVSQSWRDDSTAVIAARSVDRGPALPEAALLAYTVAPNGEVLYWADGCLHWHHICCTTGAALFPGRLDRWLINALRWLRLDQAERTTYREEAQQLHDWLRSTDPAVEYAVEVPVASASGVQ